MSFTLFEKFIASAICSIALCTVASFANEDKWDGKEYAKNSESQQASAGDLLTKYKLVGNEVILDVGCGDGKITAGMAKLVPQGHVLGVDISSSMIEAASINHKKEGGNLDFQLKDAAKIDFSQKFDLITSFTVMHWVLEQKEALKGFEKSLKPGGRIWIQMPIALPIAMQTALEETISSEKWKGYFTTFTPPWHFFQIEEYRGLLVDAKLEPLKLEVVPKNELFPSRGAFQGFLKQWFPYLRPLPVDLKDQFLTEMIDRYLKILPEEKDGKVHFIVDRLEIDARKKA